MHLQAHFDERLLVVETVCVGHGLERTQILAVQDQHRFAFVFAVLGRAEAENLGNVAEVVKPTLVKVNEPLPAVGVPGVDAGSAVLVRCVGHDPSHHPPISRVQSSSLRTSTPRAFALSAFDPASAPMTT